MTQKAKLLSGAAALAALLLSACNGQPPPVTSANELDACPADIAPNPQTILRGSPPDLARVYLDASASMKGFAGTGSVYTQVLDELRPLFLELGIHNFKTYAVGGEIHDATAPGGFSRYDDKNFYDQGETNLAEVLTQETELPEGMNGDTLTLLVTDGVTSLLGDPGPPGSLVNCEHGSDIECLVFKAGELRARRGGFWILGLRSRFQGTLFSETLATGGAPIGNADVDRPFYIWLIADHAPTAREFISRLHRRLDLPPGADSWFALEVFPGKLEWRRHSTSTASRDSTRILPPTARLGGVIGDFTPPQDNHSAELEISTRHLDGDALGVEIPLERPELAELSQSLMPLWRYSGRYCIRWQPKRIPLDLKTSLAVEDNQLGFILLSRALRNLIGVRATISQVLTRPESPETALTVLAGLDTWSTNDDSSPEQGNRTLNLNRFLTSLAGRVELPKSYEQSILTLKFNEE